MENHRSRNVLLAALILSLLVHALLALVVRTRFVPPPEAPQSVTISRLPRSVRISHLATPQPKPPHPAVLPKAVPRVVAAVPKLHSSGLSAPARAVVATPSPTPSPTPAASATPLLACANPSAPAALASAPPADIPASARAAGTSAIVNVRVTLNARAAVVDTSIARSSGNPALDIVAANMARDAQYTPAYNACKPVPGTYDFIAKFVAW